MHILFNAFAKSNDIPTKTYICENKNQDQSGHLVRGLNQQNN